MKLAIIGGSLLKQIERFNIISEEHIHTPYGEPSDSFTIAEINGMDVIYLNRHARSHHIAPHQINYKANMFALKLLDVSHVVAVTAVGGISEKMSPMKWAVPDQIIDYTHGRAQSFADINDSSVKHIDFTYPFDEPLSDQIKQAMQAVGCDYEGAGTYGVTQGPRLETIAEIRRMSRDGCDIVGMTAMPEAGLARELEMDYATMSLVVNWAAGAGESAESADKKAEVITMEEIRALIEQGSSMAEDIIQQLAIQLAEQA